MKLLLKECRQYHCLEEKKHTHNARKPTVTQPYIQMGLCRVWPMTVLRTVGEIQLSAQRLDFESKHTEPLCGSWKSWTLLKYKWLIFTEWAVTSSVLRVFVWFMKKMPWWNILEGFTLTSDKLVSSFQCPVWFMVLASTCVPHIAHKWVIQVFVFILWIWMLQCLKSFLCETVMYQGEVCTLWANKLWERSSLSWHKRVQDESKAGWREQDSANLLKGSYFMTIHHPMSKVPYPFKASASELVLSTNRYR